VQLEPFSMLDERIFPMRHLFRLLVATALAALALPALASAAPAATRGVVVQRDLKSGTLVLATRDGGLKRVHASAAGRLVLGTIVNVRGTTLSVLGHSRTTRVRGVVVRRTRSSFALAGNGSVLAINASAPPAAGGQMTTTVQVTPTALSDDGHHRQVDGAQAPAAELRGTVLTQSATTLQLNVAGFPAGLTIALGGNTIPVLAAGTLVEVHVSLGPDPANANGIVLTLVSLHVEDRNGQVGAPPTPFVHGEGVVTALTEAGPTGGTAGSITIAGEHGLVTFAIPAGFGATGAAIGDRVEAKGTASATAGALPTLVRLERSHGGHGSGDGGGGNRGPGSGDGGSSGDD
jgi:uncharacterized membrane protein YgcG